VWFCNRECQVVVRKELGHRGANCRAVHEAQAAPSQHSTPMNAAELSRSYNDLMEEAHQAHMDNTRIGNLAATEKFKEAAAVADLIGGAEGAGRRADADQHRSTCLIRLGDIPAAARAACASLRAARASGITMLIATLSSCGEVARRAPGEMVNAEREIREHERRCGSPSYGGLDLSQEGRVNLPTTPAALCRLSLAYHEAAVAICNSALAAAGGRGSPADNDDRRIPSLQVEARARVFLGDCLDDMGEERQRSLELLRQAVALRRQVVRTAAPGHDTLEAQRWLADDLTTVAGVFKAHGSDGIAGAEACLREALALSEGLGNALQTGNTLAHLINLCGEVHAAVGTAEAEALRSRLNQLLVQMGRSPETSCLICLEPLASLADGTAEDAAGGSGGGAAGSSDSCVRVLSCDHQFHRGPSGPGSAQIRIARALFARSDRPPPRHTTELLSLRCRAQWMRLCRARTGAP